MNPPRITAPPALAFFGWRNLFTYGSVASALAAMMAAEGPSGRAHAGALLGTATLFDMLDGRFARLFVSSSPNEKRFGAQLDSLADAVAFGIAPVVCLYRLGANGHGLQAVAFALLAVAYVLAALTRLGTFNVIGDTHEFVGLPTTLAGLGWTVALALPPGPWLLAAIAVLAAAMVSSIRIERPRPPAMAMIIGCVAVLVGLHMAVALAGAARHRASAGTESTERSPS
jgi:CDP-diacylglycerol--serine O-phosphatidyltransferase